MRRLAVLVLGVAALAVAVVLLLRGRSEPAAGVRLGPLPARIALGVNASAIFNPPGPGTAVLERHLAGMERAGVRLVRTDALWQLAEPRPGVMDWTQADGIATVLARHRIRWWPVLGYAPGWASAVSGSLHSPPRDPGRYGRFVGAFARRYGAGGAFWRAHPALPRLPVRDVELWNEPNVSIFWAPRPDPASYAATFVAGATALRRADPGARAVLGGIAPSRTWVPALLRAQPSIRTLAGAAALHPYATRPAGVVAHVAAFRAGLAAAGLGALPIAVTEVGWETSPRTARWFTASAAERADWLEETAHALARPALGVDALLPYAWATAERDPANEDDWYGLVPPSGEDEHTRGAAAIAELTPAPSGTTPSSAPRPGRP